MNDNSAKPAPPDVGGDEPLGIVGRRARSVRGHLALFTIALVLPILLFAGAALWRFAASERSRLESEASNIAQTIALAIDRELTGLFASLDVLSTSARLAAGDLDGFYQQGAEILRSQGIVTVVTDMSGQQLVNLRLPRDAPLPRSSLSFDPESIASGRSFVTDLVTGQVTGTRQFLAVRSVRREGVPTYILFFSLPLDRLQRIIREADVPPAYTASVIDRAGVIMARSAREEEFVGRKATRDLLDNTLDGQGTWTGTTIDGVPVFGAYARSRLSDFRAAVGIRYSDLNAPLWRSLSVFAAFGAVIVALSVMLGVFFGQRITLPIAALARDAARLGRGEAVNPVATGLLEADQVGAELATASSRLRERETELREANDELQRFAYIVSHDLRSPLVNIMGFTTELEALREDVFRRLAELRTALGSAETDKDDLLRSDVDEALGFIKASIAKMDRLINAILGLSREGRRSFAPERIDMEALMEGIKASLAHQADRAGATVSVARLPPVLSDRLALEQIFSNLIDNALKYLRNGVPGRIEIEGRAGPDGIVYEVRDNGRGIDPKDRERVFDLFRRSGLQDRPGEGIGLAHVRALVRRLGGTITLTSEPGRGSTFAVTLPRRWAGERQRKAA